MGRLWCEVEKQLSMKKVVFSIVAPAIRRLADGGTSSSCSGGLSVPLNRVRTKVLR